MESPNGLGRFGARELLYGSVDRVVAAKQAAAWIDTLLAGKWSQPKAVGAALVQLARKTGDLTRDLATPVVDSIVDWLAGQTYAKTEREAHLEALTRVVPVARQEQGAIFGESLPAGIVLRSPSSDYNNISK